MSSDDAVAGVSESTHWERVGGAWLRILRFAPDGLTDGADGADGAAELATSSGP